MSKAAFNSATRNILIALGLIALGLILWRITEVMVIAFGGIVVATLLRAMAMPLRRFRGLSDHARVGIAITALVLFVAVLGWLFGREIAAETDELRRLLPEQAQRIAVTLKQTRLGGSLVDALHNTASDGKTIGGLGIAAMTAGSAALDLILIIFLGVYFALDPELYLDGVLRLLPMGQRERVRRAFLNAGDSLRRWLLAQIAAMAIVGVLAGSMLAILGVPLALVLGGLAAVFEFIPVAGAFLFGIPGVVVAFSKGPRTALYTIIGYVAVQQIESNLIVPLLQRWAVKMPPVVSLLAVVAAGILLGPPGVVFAAPLAVVCLALVHQLYVRDTLEMPGSQGTTRPKEGGAPG
ncbi:MAG TPA: AI-2E family transporter [Opitutaceae bacterium]|jgi:predicted PurR-regulated permease PerM